MRFTAAQITNILSAFEKNIPEADTKMLDSIGSVIAFGNLKHGKKSSSLEENLAHAQAHFDEHRENERSIDPETWEPILSHVGARLLLALIQIIKYDKSSFYEDTAKEKSVE